MAINFIREVHLSRSQGHNAVDAAAYRANEKLYCERTGKTFDYTNKTDCVHKEILLPGTAFSEGILKKDHPLYDREKLWNKVEEIESKHNRHATAQLAMELKISLPKQIDRSQQIKLLQSFILDKYVDKHNVAADIAIHDTGKGNPHAHVMLSLRQVVGLELSKLKVRDLSTSQVKQSQHGIFKENTHLYQQWADYQNDYFKKHEIDLRVDQGYIIPTVHEGRVRDDPKYYDKAEDNIVIKERNAELVKSDPETIIETLQSRHSVFTDKDIKSLTFKTTAASLEENAYENTLKTVMASPELVSLGYTESGHLSYTTKVTYEAEMRLAKVANRLSGRTHISVNNKDIDRVSRLKTLTDEQHHVLKSVTQSGCTSIVLGRAGAGKTYLMGAVKDLYDAYGIKMYGTAISGKAAEGLEADAGIESRTLDSLLYQYQKDSSNLPEKGSVLVLDEAGMVGLEKMNSLLNLVQERNLKLIAVGDPDQLQPIAKGSPFRAMLERIGFAEIQTIIRQKDAGDRKASTHLAAGEIGLAIDHYLQKDAVTLDQSDVLKKQMMAQWGQYASTELSKTLMLAFKRDQVAELNALAREHLKANGLLQNETDFTVTVSGESHKKSFAAGDQIILLKNKRINGQSLKNGMLGSIESIDQKGTVAVRLDDKKDNPIITFNAIDYNHFDHGYAVTVHKAQGATKDNVLVYAAGRGWDRFLAYVGLSRHKHNLHLYADIDSYKDIHGLKRALSHTPMRDNVLDYPLQFAIRRGYDAEVSANNAASKIRQVYDKACDTWHYLFNYEAYKLEKQTQQALLDKQALNKEAKAVADLADFALDCSKQYQAFVETHGKEWYNDSKAKVAFSAIDTLFYQRNHMAHEILPQYDKFKRALDLNYIDEAKLTSWANDYVAESQVNRFYILTKTAPNRYQKGRVAQLIVDNPDCKRYVTKQGLWQAVKQAQSDYVLHTKSQQIEGFGDRLKVVESYLNCTQQAARYWQKSESEHFDSKAEGELPHQAHYANISKAYHLKAETLAAKMGDNLQGYKEVLSVKFPYEDTYTKILTGITNKIERFEKRQVIRAYIDENTSTLAREQAAFKLNQDFKGYVGIGYEEGLVWSSVAKIAHPEKMRQFRAALPKEYQALFDTIEDYKAVCRAAAEAFVAQQTIEAGLKETLGIQKSGAIPKDQLTDTLKEARQSMYQLMAERHEVAFNITESHPILREWAASNIAQFDTIHPNIDARKFMRHVGLHEERLAAQARVEKFATLTADTEANKERRMILAYEINQRLGKHMFFLQAAKIDIGHITELATVHQYNLDNAKYYGSDQRLHRDIANYMLARAAASKAWRAVRIAKQQKADITQLQQQAFALSDTRNQHAFAVSKQLAYNIDRPVYEAFTQNKQHAKNIDIGQLIKQANDYRIIDAIKSYQTEVPGTLQSKSLAGKITEEYAKGMVYHKLKALGVDAKAFYQDATAHRRIHFRFGLTAAERNCHDTVLQYIDKVQSTAKAYQSNDKNLGKQLIAERDALAYKIANAPSAHQAALLFEQVNLDKLDQHVERFCKKQLSTQVDNRLQKQAVAHEQSFTVQLPQKFSHTQKQTRLDAERINDALMANPVDTYIDIFGQPKKQSSRELRYSGGLLVTLHGKGAGKWYDFSADKGGYPVQALMYQQGLSYKDALAQGAKLAGLSDAEVQLDANRDDLLAKRAAAQEARMVADQKDRVQRIESAQSIWAATVPIKDTLAERYMSEHRNIWDVSKTELRFFPIGAKWIDYVGDDKHPEAKTRVEKINKVPAMVIAAKDQDNHVVGIQRTYLDPNTADKNRFFDNPKLSKGEIKHGAILQRGTNNKIYIGEGIETVASAALADARSTCIAALSVANLKHMTRYYDPQKHSRVVLLKDNDGLDAKSNVAFDEAVSAFKALGMTYVEVKEPRALSPENTQEKTDWNDVLKAKGREVLQRELIGFGRDIDTEDFQEVLGSYVHLDYRLPEAAKDSVQSDLLRDYLVKDHAYCMHLNTLFNEAPGNYDFEKSLKNPYTEGMKASVSAAAEALLLHPKGAAMAEAAECKERAMGFVDIKALKAKRTAQLEAEASKALDAAQPAEGAPPNDYVITSPESVNTLSSENTVQESLVTEAGTADLKKDQSQEVSLARQDDLTQEEKMMEDKVLSPQVPQEKDLTQKEVMAEIEKNHQYLKDNWWKHTDDEKFGVKDFQGNQHNYPRDYLVAVGQDDSVYDKIDYDSKVGREIRTELKNELKQYIPPRCMAGLKELQQPAKESQLTAKEVMAEIEKNHQYLKDNWWKHTDDEKFGVKDFQGNLQNLPSQYLVDVAHDPSVYNKIDYDSPIGKEIRATLESTLNQRMPQRCIAELREMQINDGMDKVRTLSIDRSSGLEL